jgi:hypothetical protein
MMQYARPSNFPRPFNQIGTIRRYCLIAPIAFAPIALAPIALSFVPYTASPAVAQPPGDSARLVGAQCPPKSAGGGQIVEVEILFSTQNPKQDVICTYSDGPGASFQVDKGCDVYPTSSFADGMGSGPGFSFGRHECRESVAGEAKCQILCPHK